MPTEFDSNLILSKKQREERVLDLHFNQNKNYLQIAQEMKMSLHDIGEDCKQSEARKRTTETQVIICTSL